MRDIDLHRIISEEIRYFTNYNLINNGKAVINDNDNVIVYHGCGILDALNICMDGLSGKSKVIRNWTFRSDDNPYGLFVSTDFNIYQHENYAWNGAVIEFKAKKSSLKTVNDGSDDNDIENRIGIGLSELLYIGDLNPNMIKRVWVSLPNKKFRKLSRRLFIREFLPLVKKNKIRYDKNEKERFDSPKKLFYPTEHINYKMLVDTAKEKEGYDLSDPRWINDDYYFENLCQLLYPRQIIDLKGWEWYKENML